MAEELEKLRAEILKEKDNSAMKEELIKKYKKIIEDIENIYKTCEEKNISLSISTKENFIKSKRFIDTLFSF